MILIHDVAITHLPLQCGGGSSQSNNELDLLNHQQVDEGKNDSSELLPMEDDGPNGEASNNESSGSEKVLFESREKIPYYSILSAGNQL